MAEKYSAKSEKNIPMLSEVQIYEKDGLFHNIVKLSKVMAGRYTAISDGSDMNTNNVASILEAAKEKYPIVACTIPYSIIQRPGWEDFAFRIFFLCTTNYTGDNQIKVRDPGTNTSMHNERFDVNDMKIVALNFLRALEMIQEAGKGKPVHFKDKQPYKLHRIVNKGNDKLSGCFVDFQLASELACDYTDIDLTGIDLNTLLTVPQHAAHYH